MMSYAIKVTFRSIPDYRQIVSEELWKAAETTRQQYQENLEKGLGADGSHGRPGESLRDLLQRMKQTMSKNQTAEHLGISKATLYEWRKAEGVE